MSRCGCCDGIEVLTPAAVENRPGLDELAYRIGTHGSFLRSMLARLSSSDHPVLGALTVRSGDDFAVGLLDAWALVADILTFYQERIATEGFLRTATERRSLVELARLVGYTLRPGLSASVHLAFTLDPDPFDAVVRIPKGARAQSVPGPAPGEKAQSFETSDDLAARPSWNRLEPRLTRPTVIGPVTAALVFEGTTTGLAPNDPILVIKASSASSFAVRAQAVAVDFIAGRTVVQVQGAETAAVDAHVQAVIQALGRALEDDAGSGPLADKLRDATLEPLAADLGKLAPAPGPAPQKASAVASALRPALASLTETLAQSRRLGSTRLVGWLTPLHQAVGSALQAMASFGPTVLGTSGGAVGAVGAVGTVGAPGTAGGAGVASVSTGGTTPSEPAPTAGIPGLHAVAAALAVRPTVPLPSPRALARSAAELLGPTSDTAPRLIGAFEPAIAGGLASALARANVTGPSPVESVQVPRVHAVPFGATAGPQVLTDDEGVVSTQEWPLDGTLTRAVEVGMSADGESAAAFVIMSEGQDSVGALVTEEQPSADLGRFGSVEMTITNEEQLEVTLTFTGGPVVDRIVIQPGSSTRLSFDGPPPFHFDLAGGQTLRRVAKARRTSVSLSFGGTFTGAQPVNSIVGFAATFPAVLSIRDEVDLPAEPRNVLALDGPYEKIVPGSWALVERPGSTVPVLVSRVVRVETIVKDAFNLRAKVTQLTLADEWLTSADVLLSDIRNTTVHVQTEALTLAQEPVDDDVFGSEVELGRLYSGLEPGRWIIVEGERTDIPGVPGVRAGELSMVGAVTHDVDAGLPGDRLRSTLHLVRPLTYRFDRKTVVIWGNVARATHGETRSEVLGSGDRTKSFQLFGLRQPPLTYLPAPNAVGAESALEVRVDGVLWHKADSLLFLQPTDQRFVTLTGADDNTTLVFGNGVLGARLPTGIENVKAVYRNGLGRAGNVVAGRISQLQTRPLGVSGVVNPLDATGGADRDSTEQARRNTPAAVMALDRIVSLRDYEDFARNLAGIGKARAVRLSNGVQEVVHLTVAGADGIEIDPISDLFSNLRRVVAELGDPHQSVEVAVREPVLLIVSAGFRAAPDFSWELVEPAVRAAMHEHFSFDRQDLGQDVLLSEVIATIAAVRGVEHVDVDVLAKVERHLTPGDLHEPPQPRVVVEDTRFERVVHQVRSGETLSAIAAGVGTTVDDLLRLNDLVDLALPAGTRLVVRQGIRPAQLCLLAPDVPETLILREIKP